MEKTEIYNGNTLDKFKTIFSCIDNTTLEGADTHQKVDQLCMRSLQMTDRSKGIPTVAAVCVYPVFVRQAKHLLEGSGIKVASVAGAFPAGQSPIEIKLAEVRYALNEGADEIDMVISRGSLLEGNDQKVKDEVAAIKEACGDRHLKAILETGELQNSDNIYRASMLAMQGGADFIKTSTGKIAVSATPESAQTMLQAIVDFEKTSSRKIGFKAAGGISTPDQALEYYNLTFRMMGHERANNQYFRIGASRLTNRIFELLTQ